MAERRIHIFDIEKEPRFGATNEHCRNFFPDAHIVSHGWYPNGITDRSEDPKSSETAFNIVQAETNQYPDDQRLVITNITGIHNGFLRKMRDLQIPSLTCVVTTCWAEDTVEEAILRDPRFRDFHNLDISIVHSRNYRWIHTKVINFYETRLRAAFEALPSDNPFHLKK